MFFSFISAASTFFPFILFSVALFWPIFAFSLTERARALAAHDECESNKCWCGAHGIQHSDWPRRGLCTNSDQRCYTCSHVMWMFPRIRTTKGGREAFAVFFTVPQLAFYSYFFSIRFVISQCFEFGAILFALSARTFRFCRSAPTASRRNKKMCAHEQHSKQLHRWVRCFKTSSERQQRPNKKRQRKTATPLPLPWSSICLVAHTVGSTSSSDTWR